MIKVIHKNCGKVAFYFKQKLNRGDLIHLSNVMLINGKQPRPMDRMACGSCGKYLISSEIKQEDMDFFEEDDFRI
jgi:hypothetical protein